MPENRSNKNLIRKIKKQITAQIIKSTFNLPGTLKQKLNSCKKESEGLEKKFFKRMIENLDISQKNKIPACQDTGIFEVWVNLGKNLKKNGLNLDKIITRAVKNAHREGKLRRSMPDGVKPVLHFEFWDKNFTEIILTPRGFGSENYSFLHMLNPETGFRKIIKMITGDVKKAGSRPCPPFLIGVGLGGTASKAVELSSLALTRMDFKPTDREKGILQAVNKLKIGAGGTGGQFTAIGAKVLNFPAHIAGLAMGVHIGCWCNRVRKIKIYEKA